MSEEDSISDVLTPTWDECDNKQPHPAHPWRQQNRTWLSRCPGVAPPAPPSQTEVKALQLGDELALAAAQVCTEYDGVHRLRAKLSKWYGFRAGIHSEEGNDGTTTTSA